MNKNWCLNITKNFFKLDKKQNNKPCKNAFKKTLLKIYQFEMSLNLYHL